MRAVLLTAILLSTGMPLVIADDGQTSQVASTPAKSDNLTPEQRVELIKALEAARMLRQYQAGKIQLKPEQVQEYRATLSAYTAVHPGSGARSTPKVMIHNVRLRDLEQVYRTYSGKAVVITDRAGIKLVTLEAKGPSNEEIVAQLDSALKSQGFVVTHTDNGTTIDSP